MATFTLPNHVQKELAFDGPLQKGARGMKAKRAQEWLSFHKFGTAVDSDFGPATEDAVRSFQKAKKLTITGIINEATWQALIAPLNKALAPMAISANDSLPKIVLKVAKQHLAQHPLELGGDNCGPWVRVYMNGLEGPDEYWCAGFVTFILRQACGLMKRAMPLAGSFSCDSLAYQAKQAGLFVSGASLAKGTTSWSQLGDCQIFLVRKTDADWTHTGFSFGGSGATFSTIEGNTNDEGSRNGYEVCQRRRSIDAKDFIRLPK